MIDIRRTVLVCALGAAAALFCWAAVWWALHLDIAGVVSLARFIGSAAMTIGALVLAALAWLVAANGIRGG